MSLASTGTAAGGASNRNSFLPIEEEWVMHEYRDVEPQNGFNEDGSNSQHDEYIGIINKLTETKYA